MGVVATVNNSISVIIPVRNMAGTINAAITSALAVGCQDVIVADDNSDDGSGHLAASYPSDFVNTLITMRGSVPAGVCAVRNRAIQAAAHDWLLPLDADDELLPDALYILRKYMRSEYDPRPVIPGGYFIYTGYLDEQGYHSPPPIDKITRKNVAHATFLFHRADWLRVGGYDSDFFLGEDWGFMLALLNAGVQPIRIDEPIYKRGGVNVRTDRARRYWPTIWTLAREKYPALFENEPTHHALTTPV